MAFRPGMPDAGSFPFALLSRLIAKHAKFARDNLFGMYHVAGHPALRAAIATYLKTARGVKCTPEQIVVTTGAQAAMDLLARLFLDRGDTVWTEEPGYYGAQSAFVAAGAKLASLPVDRNGWRLDNTPNADPRLIYITPSCQHPLGMTMRMEQRLRLLDIAQSLNSLIIEDDFDGEYQFVGQSVPSLQGHDRNGKVIYLGSFAKTLFPALRLGFMVVPIAFIPGMTRALSITGQFPPLLLQATLADFIDQGHMARHLRRTRRLYAQRRLLFYKLCEDQLQNEIHLLTGNSGIQITGLLSRRLDDHEVVAAAQRRGVEVSPLSMQYHHGSASQGLVLGYAACDEAMTRKGLRLLAEAIRSVR